MKYTLEALSVIVMVMSITFSIILLLTIPTEPIWLIFFGIGTLSGFIFFINFLLNATDDDYDYGYDDGKKETTNEEKKPFIVKLKTTCPHCGAPMKNDTCAYCGCKSEIYKVIQ